MFHAPIDPAAGHRRALVLMPCGATKRPTPAKAGDLYTGPMWQSYRAALAALDPEWHRRSITLAILSAEHGLVPASAVIGPYDRQMTPDRLPVLRDGVGAQIATLVASGAWLDQPLSAVVTAGGALYREMAGHVCSHLQALGAILPDAPIFQVRGTIGLQRQGLKRVLTSLPDVLARNGRPALVAEIQAAQSQLFEEMHWAALECVKVPTKARSRHLAAVLKWLHTRPELVRRVNARLLKIQAHRSAEVQALAREMDAALLLADFGATKEEMRPRRLTTAERADLIAAEALLDEVPERALAGAAAALALPKRGGRFIGSAYLSLQRAAYRQPSRVLSALRDVADRLRA